MNTSLFNLYLSPDLGPLPPPSNPSYSLPFPPTASGRHKTVDEPIEGGVRSLLVISAARDSDFGLYNCTFHNEYGADSASVILQKQGQ